MNSCLYECHVLHARFAPRPHRFLYRIFLFAFDLDEVPALARRLPLFSLDRANFYSFRDRDYLPTTEPSFNGRAGPPGPPEMPPSPAPRPALKARVAAHLAAHGLDLAGGRVLLVTLPRIAGHLFNPVSFYFCYRPDDTPLAALAEVTNTFREVKPFLLGPATLVPLTPDADLRSPVSDAAPRAAFRLRIPKHFYVSPFSDVDVAFDFTLRPPGDRLAVQIDDYAGATRTLTSTLAGPRRELTSARLAWFTLKYPLLSLRIIALIHAHALLLWLKRVPWFPKAARAADQRDLFRPHTSLATHASVRPR